MDFVYSRRVTKTRTSTILNESDVKVVASQENPSTTRYYSSPNSTQVTDINFQVNKTNMLNTSGGRNNQSMETSRHNSSRHDEVIEAKIKANENYLKQLKSIDLTKYSFPNE